MTGLGNSVDGIFVDTRSQTSAAPNNPTNYSAFIGPGNIIGYNGDAGTIPGADVVNDADSGIEITGNSSRVQVLGNFIGVGEDPVNNGTFVNIGNNGDCINISRGDLEIGGYTFPEANIISSNKRHGIAVRGSGTDTVKITGNIIGRDPLNLVNQSNDQDGIRIFESSSIQIGGTASGEENVNGDVVAKVNETFVVNLTAPSNATVADAQGQGTITNDDAAAAAPTLSVLPAAVTLNGGTGTVTVTVATAGVATASVALACTIPAGTASFAISGGANRTINAPAALGANAPAIGLSCTPQAVAATATLSCTQTETPAGAALPALMSTITCPGVTPIAITANTAPGALTLPSYISPGASSSSTTLNFAITGGNGAMNCVASGAGYSITPANPVPLTVAGPNLLTVSYSGSNPGTFAGGLSCTSVAPATGGPFVYTFNTTVGVPVAVSTIPVPALGNISLMLLIAGFLGLGVVLMRRQE